MKEKMEYMDISLPENIEKAKWHGDFEKANRIIERFLNDAKTPQCMKERLILEQDVLQRLPREYPYDEEEALAVARKEIPDFTLEELREYEERGDAQWIYVNGIVHLHQYYFDTLKKVIPSIAKRCGEMDTENVLLDDNVRIMKEQGKRAACIRLKASIRIRDEAFREGNALVHLPVPIEAMNMKNIRILNTSPEGAVRSAAGWPVQTVSWQKDLKENETFSVEYEYDTEAVYHDLKDAKGEACDMDEYLQEERGQIEFTPLIRSLCDELKGEETAPLKIARAFYDYCTVNGSYTYVRSYKSITRICDYYAAGRRGDCGIQALLFITLCRCAGIPARWQSGLYVTEEDTGNHDWAMFYVKPYGWLFADPSFGGSAYRSGAQERHDYYFGNLDVFRMAANSEFQYEMDPPKQGIRIDPYDNQSGEAELDGRGLPAQDVDHDIELISFRDL